MMDVIVSYGRKEAIEDGVLIDVSTLASEAGFIFPVAMTNALYGKVGDIPEDFSHQDLTGRLWDILFVASVTARNSKGDVMFFEVDIPHVVIEEGEEILKEVLKIKSIIGPGDQMEPVITMMLPNED